VEPVAVLGGSNLGYCYAADLATRGVDVTLWVRDRRGHQPVLDGRRLTLTGVDGTADVRVAATTDLDAALRCDLLIVGLPANDLPELAGVLRHRLEPRHVVVLTPGNGGAVTLHAAAPEATVAETAHPLFGARRSGPDTVDMVARAVELPTGSLPTDRALEVCQRLDEVAGRAVFTPARSVLDAALNNPNPIFHTVPCVLNIGYLQGVESFHLYRDGMSRGVLSALYAADEERIALRKACGYGAPHYPQWTILEPDPSSDERALFEVETFRMASRSPEYHGPHTLDHRFIHEDTLNLVLWTDLARVAGVDTPVMDAVVAMVGAASGRDYLRVGRTLVRVGLPDTTLEAVLAAVA
jgi:opine dehydrogenase